MKTTAEISNTNTQVKLSVGDELAQTLLAMDGRDKEIAYAGNDCGQKTCR